MALGPSQERALRRGSCDPGFRGDMAVSRYEALHLMKGTTSTPLVAPCQGPRKLVPTGHFTHLAQLLCPARHFQQGDGGIIQPKTVTLPGAKTNG